MSHHFIHQGPRGDKLDAFSSNCFEIGQKGILNSKVLAFKMKYDELQVYTAVLYFFSSFVCVLSNRTVDAS
jgi:hypothetical protein